MSTAHTTFVIERLYPAPLARVWEAWSDPARKSRWFGAPDDWEGGAYALDFRIGGTERSQGGPPGGDIHYYKATIMDIVPHERLVYAYDLLLGDRRISASLATVELRPEGDGTRQVFTEQGAYFERGQAASDEREHGTGLILDALGASVETAKA